MTFTGSDIFLEGKQLHKHNFLTMNLKNSAMFKKKQKNENKKRAYQNRNKFATGK